MADRRGILSRLFDPTAPLQEQVAALREELGRRAMVETALREALAAERTAHAETASQLKQQLAVPSDVESLRTQLHTRQDQIWRLATVVIDTQRYYLDALERAVGRAWRVSLDVDPSITRATLESSLSMRVADILADPSPNHK
jgi:hypothetical protein